MAGERARNVRWGTRTKRQIKTILPYLGMILDQLANVQVRRFLGDSDSLQCVVGRMTPMRRTTPIAATVAGVAQSIGGPSTALACTLRCAGCITRTDLAYYRRPFRRPTFDACRSPPKLQTAL